MIAASAFDGRSIVFLVAIVGFILWAWLDVSTVRHRCAACGRKFATSPYYNVTEHIGAYCSAECRDTRKPDGEAARCEQTDS